ncbi:hypothetical protein ABZ608_26585 [Streptomyces sp. NPDC013172]|uniref:hypothetical protein n=1 Tax=Streptomyces sp. NPDC013172 TaxID=3155009 RepID=UPI0033CB5205
MTFTANVGDYNHNTLSVSYSVDLQGLAPCSDLVFDADAWMYRPTGSAHETYPHLGTPLRAEDGWKKQPSPHVVQVDYLTFADADGQSWQRNFGTLKPWTPPHSIEGDKADQYGIGGIPVNPQEKPVASCG